MKEDASHGVGETDKCTSLLLKAKRSVWCGLADAAYVYPSGPFIMQVHVDASACRNAR